MTKATIRARDTGRGVVWQLRYRHNGKQRSRTFSSEKDARRARALLDTVGADEWGRLLDQTPADTHVVTLTEVHEHYLSHHMGREGTVEEYRLLAKRSFLPDLGAIPVHAITRDMIAAWVRKRDKEGKSSKTIANEHGHLSATLNDAVERRLIPFNPCRGIKLPRHEVGEEAYITVDEFYRLVAAFPERDRPMVVVLGGTGMRWGEITALQWRDVNLNARQLHIRRGWHRVTGKGYVLEGLKTKRARRILTLNDTLVRQFELVKAQSPDTSREAYVFTTARGNVIRHSNYLPRTWHPARAKAGLPADVTPHALRHSHTSWAIAAGMAPLALQYRLGHDKGSSITDRYTHLMPGVVAQADAVAQSILADLDGLDAIEGTTEEAG